ncbi:MAG TPA: hypothetical protein VIL65_08230 [Beijerinckiaceae bacterium]|jgi:hypothetical protein
MKRIVLAALALTTAMGAVVPAQAQYYGGGGGGYGRGYDDDGYRPRRPRGNYYEERRGLPGRPYGPPPGFDRRQGGPPPGFGPGPRRQAGQAMCATRAGMCPSFPYPAGSPCRCQLPGRPGGVIVYR